MLYETGEQLQRDPGLAMLARMGLAVFGLVIFVLLVSLLPGYVEEEQPVGILKKAEGGYTFYYKDKPVEVRGEFVGNTGYYIDTGKEMHFMTPFSFGTFKATCYISIIKIKTGYFLVEQCPFYQHINYATVDLNGSIQSTTRILQDKKWIYKELEKYDSRFTKLLQEIYEKEKTVIQ